MARVTFNGPPGEVFTNSTDKVLYQFLCNFSNTCGLCFQYHRAIGPSWPIPLHRGCNCHQTAVWPGQSAEPYVDFREIIRELSPSQQMAVMGRSNLRLVESMVVRYEDVVTRTRVRDFREVVSRQKLSVDRMVDAGVVRRHAEQAYLTVNTPAHQLADIRRRELVDRLRGKGIADDVIRRAVSERIAARVGIGEGPSGPGGLGIVPITPVTPRPKPKPRVVKPKPEPKPVDPMQEALTRAEALGIKVIPESPQPVTIDQINAVIDEVAKIPRFVLDVIAKAGKRMDILSGRGVTDHPEHVSFKGVTPRGWEGTGKTWDDVPGTGSGFQKATVIVANRLKEGHGSRNLVIHEHAHTFDSSWRKIRGVEKEGSRSDEWLDVWKKAKWKSAYEKNYPEEGFAESFASYFHDSESRKELPSEAREFWDKKVVEWSRREP